MVDQTAHIDTDLAVRAPDVALKRTSQETTGQLRARIQKLMIAIDPDSARQRYEGRLKDRRVVNQATEGGTANLMGLDLPIADSNAAMRRLDRMAHRLKASGDPRTIDQIRADLYLDLLNGRATGQPQGEGGVVDIRVDLTTLADLDDNPGQIPGWGPGSSRHRPQGGTGAEVVGVAARSPKRTVRWLT
ncbi:MAG: DUF222 domain-containing protein [Acidimicrobiia bacterium]